MLLNKFKDGKEIQFTKSMKAFIKKNYDNIDFTQFEGFMNSIGTAREIVGSLNKYERSVESLKAYKENIVGYIRMLNLLKTKFNFANDKYSVAIEFGWRDLLTNDFYYAYSIHHEYYCSLFNLAITYFNIASLEKQDEEDKIKESIKNYQYASFIFDKIKQEIDTVIAPKDIQPDLSSGFLTYAGYYSLSRAQILIYQIAKKKGLSFELQAQLSKGVFDLLTNTINIASESFKKYFTEDLRIFMNYTRYYYFADSLLRMVDNLEEDFKLKGEGFGKMVAYTGLALNALNEGEKNIQVAKSFLNLKTVSDYRAEIELKYKTLSDKNSRLYYDSVPQPGALPKIEKLVKANQISLPDDFNKVIPGQECLDDMVPKEVKAMIENYKRLVSEYINKNLEKYENENGIVSFLSSLGLPASLESIISSDDLSESLWKRISDTQRKGGPMFLTNSLSTLEKKSEEIGQKIQDLENQLTNESNEDGKYRHLYMNNWTRQSSINLNSQFFQALFNYKQKLSQAKACDLMLKDNVSNNMKYFEILNLSREQLKKKIPVQLDLKVLTESQEIKQLQAALEEYEKLKEGLKENHTKLFQTLNEDNVITQMIKVLQKKTTEQAIFADNISKYDVIFKAFDEINPKISELKTRIQILNQKFVKLKMETLNTNSQNDVFFQELENYVQLFNEKSSQVLQGLNFYGDFNFRISEINQKVSDFIMSRDIEKNELLKRLTGGGGINNSVYSGNPNQNPVTNLGYNYQYNQNYYNPNQKNPYFR